MADVPVDERSERREKALHEMDEIERSLDALRVYAADGRSSMPKRNARRCRDEVLAELQRLTEIEEAAREVEADLRSTAEEMLDRGRENEANVVMIFADNLRTELDADRGGQGE